MSARLRFSKMHGLGNDFVVIDTINQSVDLTPERIRKLSDRHFGVGCDQVLAVTVPQQPHNDFGYRIFNHDGSEVENCGNGARCFAKFVRDKKLTGKRSIRVETLSGEMVLHINRHGDITVDMGLPTLAPENIPFQSPLQSPTYLLPLNGQSLEISAISMGNPHAVTLVDDVHTAAVDILGPQIEAHPYFPQKTNVGFMAVKTRNTIALRVYERGVGETLACGTGACAAVVAGQLRELLDPVVTVNLPGGQLQIEWQGEGHPVLMTGPATTVFQGQVKL
ncbi:diaminopimelate epimerase [Candidatus Endobugula sertula]|uniref:Diaminopimelate epimerase n=1 Tax=Candidatus Endobugula sertula TaxID=62101 RepID=A0A1D2QRA1_9GAMM|nr:diaminopimelate epimerase [Candidatus Endobugula sertula]